MSPVPEVVEEAGSLPVEALLSLWVPEVHGYDWLALYWEALLWALVPLSVLLQVVEALLHGPCEYMDYLHKYPLGISLSSSLPQQRDNQALLQTDKNYERAILIWYISVCFNSIKCITQ